jgi:DNA repair exonuclease SbcCD ATPase subunit
LFEEKIFKKNKDLDQQKSVKQGQVELLFKQFQNANKGIECIDDLESELKQLESDRVEFASAKKIYENNLLHQKQKIEIEKLTIELKTLQNQIIGSEERKKLGEKLLNGQLRNQLISSLPAMNLQEIENELQKEREKQILNAKQMEKFTKFKKIKSELDGLSDFIISCPWENCLKPIIMIGQRVEKATEQPVSGKRKRSMEESERFYEASKFLKSFQNIQFDSKKLNELNEMHQQHILLSNKLKEIGNNFLNDDLENLKSLQEKIKQDEKNIERKKVVEQILKSFSPVPHEQVAEQIFNQDELIEREAKLKNKIKFHNEFLNSQKIKQEYNQYETEFQSLIAYLTKIQIIVRVWNESKTYCIENITAILQSKVNELIGDFFVKPLTISITCWRSMKNKNEKPGFEIVINDENNKLLVNELSGGEKSRLSIAFSCALAELNHSSFLLLDEAMAGLDFLNCQQVVKSLHQWAIDKSIAIVIIAHNISKEYFDQIISLEK